METLEQVAKTAQDIFIGIGSLDPADKENMMAYAKQLKNFTTMYDEQAIFMVWYEDLHPHGCII
jgi:hypothetical protein